MKLGQTRAGRFLGLPSIRALWVARRRVGWPTLTRSVLTDQALTDAPRFRGDCRLSHELMIKARGPAGIAELSTAIYDSKPRPGYDHQSVRLNRRAPRCASA